MGKGKRKRDTWAKKPKPKPRKKKKKKLKMLSALICFGQTPVGHCTVRRSKLRRIIKIVPRGLGLEG